MFGTSLTTARGDSWVIPVDNDTSTLERVEKLTDKEDRFTEFKLKSHITGKETRSVLHAVQVFP